MQKFCKEEANWGILKGVGAQLQAASGGALEEYKKISLVKGK